MSLSAFGFLRSGQTNSIQARKIVSTRGISMATNSGNKAHAPFLKISGLEDCPWESGPKQDDWLRGWMATELITFGEFCLDEMSGHR